MDKLARGDLMSLETYAVERAAFRARVMEHKRPRRLAVGPHATLYFEDRLTMQYQVQEILRTERIFEPDAIAEELEAYNPLIPDGANWKATFMLEYADEDERREALARLVGIEERVWVRIGGADGEPVYAIADEDLERSTGEKTSSVHFLRFELPPALAREVARDAGGALSISFGIDHPEYEHRVEPVPEATRASLAADLDPLLS